jgi:YesN/AraC family two-component response regulator
MATNIVIVEDLDEVREGLTNFIADSPDLHVSGAFKTGEDALQDIPHLQPDIVIMDINLPGLTGIECINRLRGKLKKTQFMMFTVYVNFPSRQARYDSTFIICTKSCMFRIALKRLIKHF